MPRGGKREGAGRPVAAHTIQAEALKKALIEAVLKEREPLIKALITKGKKGDVAALREIFDRALGKVALPMEHSGPEGRPIPILQILAKKQLRISKHGGA